LSSSVIEKIVSQDCHFSTIFFLSAPNHVGDPGSASGVCARMVPKPGGKYSCSRQNREYSGSEASRLSQLATVGP